MPRLPFSLAALITLPLALVASDPKPDGVERAVAVQQAMAAAEQYLAGNMPGEAVAVLEGQLDRADGSRAFLALLRRAYAAELKQLEMTPTADPDRLARVRKMLDLIGAPKADEPATQVASAEDPAGGADAEFKKGNYERAARLYAQAAAGPAKLTSGQTAAWAYCRIRLAADAVNGPRCDPASAAGLVQDLTAALQLVPDNPELQKVGQAVLAAARSKAGGAAPAASPGAASAGLASPGLASPERQRGESTPDDWDVIDGASFRVRFKGTREVAEAVARAAEAKRAEIFERWSGPPPGPWQPRCEIVLHPTAECYAKMTGKPAAGTGHAEVRLTSGRVAQRRIDLRADDPGVVANALPRELTHVVLSDLFPDRPPPKWAEEGMAVLAGSPEEVGRYARTLPRCARNGELVAVAALLEMKDFPGADRITGFYCASVTLVDYLVRLGGERNFTLFLRDCQRYGTASALKRQYNLDGPQALEAAWKRATLDVARGQGQ
jgi:hypothetical protein